MLEVSLEQLVVLFATVSIVIGCGILAARSVHSSEGYSLGGRSAGAPMVAGAIAGACVGGGATVGTAQLAASIGLSAIWFTAGTGLALIVMGLFYARPLRRSSLTTVSQYIVQNYGHRAGLLTSLASSIGILLSTVASSLPGISLIMAITGMQYMESALLLLLLVAAYAFFGGMKSAGLGGILKMLIIWASLCLAGISAWQSLQAPEISSAIPAGWWNPFAIGTESIAVSLLSLLVGMLCTQTYIQAIFSASNPRTAAAGAFMAALITIPVGLPCALIGMYMHAAYPELQPLLSLPAFLLEHQPVLLGSIAMGGIVLSLVSSIAGLSLGISTMLSRDILAKFLPVHGKRELRITQGVFLAVVATAFTIAIANRDSQVLFWNYLSMALRGAGVFLPLTLAIFRPRAVEEHWAAASMLLATAVTLAATLLGSQIRPLFLGLIIGMAVLVPGLRLQRHCHGHGAARSQLKRR